jgi:4-hydroxy-2-oxoheptanedioate aldolase
MSIRPNATKRRLLAGGLAVGTIVPGNDPALVEISALAGFDHVIIDGEHGSVSVRDVEDLVRAAEAVGITPLARVPSNTPVDILRFLDAGVMGVMVPQVRTADDARRAVAAARYHPEGQRGLAGSRAARYGLAGSLADYVAAANREVMVMALLEDRAAVENIDAILAVPGIDVFFIGPADLAQSYGYPGRADQPEVQAAIDTIIRRAVGAGKVVGTNAPTGAAATALYERGVRYLCTGLWGLLAGALRDYRAHLPALSDEP